MKAINKMNREKFLKTVPVPKRRRSSASAQYRKTIKIQLKRPKYTGKGGKKVYHQDGDQRQISFNKTTTMDNVLKACAKEYLKIDDNDYEYEIARQKLELFLLDGKAVVKDPSYTFNKTAFNFVYIKKNELSWAIISDSSDEESREESTGSKNVLSR